ncbi:MAG: thiopeptide-type bacteriocin biosynthesis protein [Saprospiraceae bacterium]
MSQWLSYHFFPEETPDIFLVRGFKPFLEQHIWKQKGARAFFIRYEDASGQHLRLRLKAEASYLEDTIKPAFKSWMEERGRFEEVPYQAETARFGSPEALALAEEHFHLSTQVVLQRLSRPYTYGDALFDGLRMHLSTVFAIGMERPRAAWYFEALCRQWIPVFFAPDPEHEIDLEAEVLQDFETSFEKQKETLMNANIQTWDALQQDSFDKNQPEWLRWFRGNQLIFENWDDSLEKALPSLIHLTNNRLGINNQDEVYLNYILGRSL